MLADDDDEHDQRISHDPRAVYQHRTSNRDKYQSDEWSISTAGTSIAATPDRDRYGRSSSLSKMFQAIPEGSDGKQ